MLCRHTSHCRAQVGPLQQLCAARQAVWGSPTLAACVHNVSSETAHLCADVGVCAGTPATAGRRLAPRSSSAQPGSQCGAAPLWQLTHAGPRLSHSCGPCASPAQREQPGLFCQRCACVAPVACWHPFDGSLLQHPMCTHGPLHRGNMAAKLCVPCEDAMLVRLMLLQAASGKRLQTELLCTCRCLPLRLIQGAAATNPRFSFGPLPSPLLGAPSMHSV